MWNTNLRPYGEYFAQNQTITTTSTAGNVTANNPTRLDASQGATAIVVATPKGTGTLTVATTKTVTLTVKGAKTAAGTPVVLGTAVFTNDTAGNVVFGPDAKVCECIIGNILLKYPYVSVEIAGSAAPTGTVDIFPAYVSHNGR